MKIFLKDLVNIADQKTYPFAIEEIAIKNNLYLRAISNINGDISFYYDASDKLRINYSFSGVMICPDAITLEDVEVPFELNEDEEITRDNEEDGFYLNEDMELEDLLVYIVLPEVPIKVVKNEKIEYSRGDGWSFVSEEDFNSHRKEQIDPRLQKLKEYKFEEDD